MNGISEKQKKAKRDQIILKCIENSYTTHIVSAEPLGWKSELFNYKDIIKYKLLILISTENFIHKQVQFIFYIKFLIQIMKKE